MTRYSAWLLIALSLLSCANASERRRAAPSQPSPTLNMTDAQLLDDVEKRSFHFFWDLADPHTQLVPDRAPSPSFSSIAAVGFGLTAYGIGAERGYITRDQAVDRTLATLRIMQGLKQGAEATGVSGYHGFFYHFLDMKTGERFETVELSTVDTSLLMAGVLFAQSYFDRDDPREVQIRQVAEQLYAAVDWPWEQVRSPLLSMGWTPEQGFHTYDWNGYNEAMIVLILALGSPTHPVDPAAWAKYHSTDRWASHMGQQYIVFPPLFGHQYTEVWVDFRGIRDDVNRAHDLDYAENSRRASLAQHTYAVANPGGWRDYGDRIWGLTACDGPMDDSVKIDGKLRSFHSYTARGVGPVNGLDDGTIAPTAAASSIVFTPEISIPAIREMSTRYGTHLYSTYGFLDAFNPTLRTTSHLKHGLVDPTQGWFDTDYLGIDQGPIVAMIENYRSGLVWQTMKKNPHIVQGLKRAGFTGGWLESTR